MISTSLQAVRIRRCASMTVELLGYIKWSRYTIHPSICSLVRLFFPSFVSLFVYTRYSFASDQNHSSVHLFISSSVLSFVLFFVCLYSFVRLCTRLFVCPSVHPFVPLFTRSFTLLLEYVRVHSYYSFPQGHNIPTLYYAIDRLLCGSP